MFPGLSTNDQNTREPALESGIEGFLRSFFRLLFISNSNFDEEKNSLERPPHIRLNQVPLKPFEVTFLGSNYAKQIAKTKTEKTNKNNRNAIALTLQIKLF